MEIQGGARRESLEYKQDVTEWSRGNILERDLSIMNQFQSSYDLPCLAWLLYLLF